MNSMELVAKLMDLFLDSGKDFLKEHQKEAFEEMGVTRFYVYWGVSLFRVWGGESKDLRSFDESFLSDYEKYITAEGCLFYRWDDPNRPAAFPKSAKDTVWYPILYHGSCQGFVCADLGQVQKGFDKFVCQRMIGFLKAVSVSLLTKIAWNETDNSANKIKGILNCVDTYVYTINQKTYQISYISEKTHQAFPDIRVGDKCYQAFFGKEKTHPCDFCPIQKLTGPLDREIVEIYMDLAKRWFHLAATRVDWVEGEKQFLLTLNDVTELKESELALEKIAYYDQALGLYNHAAFIRKIDQLGEQQAVNVFGLIVDINDFKTFNSIFGHSIGDKLLKQIANVFLNLGLKNQTYRYSGGQFCVLIDQSELLPAVSLLREIRSRLATDIQLDGKMVDVVFNVAIVSSGEQPLEMDHFVSKIQYALEEVKQSGTNFLVLGKSVEEKLARKDLVKGILKKAVKAKQLTVVYQPIYSLHTQKFAMAEALVRLNDQTYGPISPAEFIPIAEEIGCVHEIDMLVLDKVCQDVKRLKEMGIDSIHVNMSPAQFLEKQFVETVVKVVDSYQVPHSRIILEVTETVLMNSLKKGKAVLEQFLDAGLCTSLDDFGSGYSSLNYVVNLPFKSLKIDRSLIQDIEHSERTQKLVKAIIQMSHDLQMHTVAEGVETFGEYELLKSFGCDYIQGFYFAHPTYLQQLKEAFPPIPKI